MPTSAVCFIFVLQGLTLKTSDVASALRSVGPLAFGLVSILVVTPLLGVLITQVAPPFGPREFRVGFILLSCVPTTVNSGVALAGSASGNVAVALLLTVCSNIIGIFSVPFLLARSLSGASEDIALDPLPMLMKLVLTILGPLCVGKLLQQSCAIQAFASKHKAALSMSTAASLALIPFMEISASADRIRSLETKSIIQVLLQAVLIHVAFLTWSFIGTALLGFPTATRRSVVIMSSEKAITMASAILPFLPPSAGTRGLIAIPVILGHFSQILIDACIVTRWAARPPAESAKEPAWAGGYTGARA